MSELSEKDKFEPNYLRRTYPRYHCRRYADGIDYLQTRFKPPEFGSLTFDIYVYSDTHLAACVPPLTGTSLLKRFPDKFTLHQAGEDGKVLLFREEYLLELAGPLKLSKRKQISEEERQRLAGLSRKHSHEGLRMISGWRVALSGDSRAVSESQNLPKPISEPV